MRNFWYKMYRIFIDGGSRGNPGEGAIGFIVFDSKDEEVFRFGKKIGICTNNIAEYNALLEALEHVQNNCLSQNKKVVIYSDSELLVKQVNKNYKVKSGNLRPLYKKTMSIINKYDSIRIMHIKREDNHTADWIVNRVLDGKPYEPTA
jgi:ribonuclease HI